MKPLFTLILALATLCGSAQDSTKTYSFKQIGWTVKLPPGFKALSATEDAAVNKEGEQAIEGVIDRDLDLSKTRTLFSATKNSDYFNATITPVASKAGLWEQTVIATKTILYNTFKERVPDALLDTASSDITIDGVKFYKFRCILEVDKKVMFRMFVLMKFYKGYSFGITYLCADDKTVRDIEQVLRTSKFEK